MEFTGELASSHIDVSMGACTKFDGSYHNLQGLVAT
jgi:hypothetical protein